MSQTVKTILFQGDSITDACRKDEYICHMGLGYPAYVAGRLGCDCPGQYRFVNRGISGNRIVDVYARIKRDILNLKPDVMSLLIGVNDVWHEFDCGNGIDTPKFIRLYKLLLDEIREALPDIQILLLEPFVLEGSATAAHYPAFRAQVEEKAAAVAQIAAEYDLPFISLQQELDDMAAKAGNDHWLLDGVHPTIFFHQFIADKWLEVFQSL